MVLFLWRTQGLQGRLVFLLVKRWKWEVRGILLRHFEKYFLSGKRRYKRGVLLFFHPGLHWPTWHQGQCWWAWKERRATETKAVYSGLQSRKPRRSRCLRYCWVAQLANVRTLSLKLLYIQDAINKCLYCLILTGY